MNTICGLCGQEFFRGKGSSGYCSEPCRFWSKVKVGGQDECWPWTGSLVKDGYGQFKRTSVNGKRNNITSSRFSWILTYGDIPPSVLVLHRCDNPPCCNPGHLFIGSDLDNSIDMHAKSRDNHPRGEGLGAATKLTVEFVTEIKRMKREGVGNPVIASMFGITDGHVCNIVAGRVWNYVS